MGNIHIIGEAGSNHNGDINIAKQLISVASDAKVDSVKFQIINTWDLYLPGKYEYGHYNIDDVIRIRQRDEMTEEDYKKIIEHCNYLNIPFSASVFDTKGLDLLLKFNPPYVKIASCDLNNIKFLKEVAQRGKKMVISTGMSSLGEIELAINTITKENFDDVVILHCVSVYPASLSQTNISFIETLSSAFGFPVGFSDHTGDSIAACMAMAKGATWFEKHFTIDKSLEGLDHKHAQDPSELKQYVQDLKNASVALAHPSNKVSENEIYTKKRARRSLYSKCFIKKGEIIKEDNVLSVEIKKASSANGRAVLRILPVEKNRQNDDLIAIVLPNKYVLIEPMKDHLKCCNNQGYRFLNY